MIFMVGVFSTVLSKGLPNNKKLVLLLDWEGDEGLIEGENLESLPGPGASFYTLGVMNEGDREYERVLEEFRFKGGGNIEPTDVPPKLRVVFNKWHEELERGQARS